MYSNDMFYVYVYLNTQRPGKYIYGNIIFDYEPMYIGKGHNNRMNIHLQIAKSTKITKFDNSKFIYKLKKLLLQEHTPIIIKIFDNLFEEEAFEVERFYIKWIGRQDLKTGYLYNLSDGGDGHSNRSPETIKKISRIIQQYDLNGNFIKEWKSIRSATQAYPNAYIQGCVLKKQSQAGGFIWVYKDETPNTDAVIQSAINKKSARIKKICQYDLNGLFIRVWESTTDAKKIIGNCSIKDCCLLHCKTAGGYQWRYYTDVLYNNEILKQIPPVIPVIIWNKGLTKNTDIRVYNYGINSSITKRKKYNRN